jgi:predicted metal-dependent phosphoesterase TrpH
VTSVQEAFDLWLASGRPAFIPRTGPSPASVVAAIHEAGGIASLAHPGVTKRDDLIEPLIDGGMDAIEVYHSDHTPEAEQTYKMMAERHGVAVSGGSDFHGDEARRNSLGIVSLPPEAFAALVSVHEQRRTS